MRLQKRQLRQTTFLLLTGFMLLINAAPALAASQPDSAKKSSTAAQTTKAGNKSEDISGAVSQTYNADKTVQIGMIVELKPKDPTVVIPLKQGNIKAMLGIVIPQGSATIVLTPKDVKQQQVLVARSGHYNLLVSNQNGPIKVGDYLTISAIDGVGMKADETQAEVIGKASAAFNGTSNVIGQVDLKDTLGRASKVAIGRAQIDISISHNPLFQKTVDYVPGFLANIAVTVANKPVSVARIYLSTAILFIITIVVGNMLYSGVRSGMVAVGRNPLSKKSIFRSLIQTVIAGIIIFVTGTFAVYLLLKL